MDKVISSMEKIEAQIDDTITALREVEGGLEDEMETTESASASRRAESALWHVSQALAEARQWRALCKQQASTRKRGRAALAKLDAAGRG